MQAILRLVNTRAEDSLDAGGQADVETGVAASHAVEDQGTGAVVTYVARKAVTDSVPRDDRRRHAVRMTRDVRPRVQLQRRVGRSRSKLKAL